MPVASFFCLAVFCAQRDERNLATLEIRFLPFVRGGEDPECPSRDGGMTWWLSSAGLSLYARRSILSSLFGRICPIMEVSASAHFAQTHTIETLPLLRR